MERLFKKVMKKGKYIAIKCDNTPCDNDSESFEYGGGTPEEWLVWKKLLKALDSKSISMGRLQYTFTDPLLTCDKKATFNQAALIITRGDVTLNCHVFSFLRTF